MQPDPSPAEPYDAVIIGGAIAGAGTAITLLRKHPAARVLVVERSERFEKKVGEATVECSALWLTAALGLGRTLAEHHLPKHGLRFFFDEGRGGDLADLDELGPKRQAAMTSFHLDRPRLDGQALAAAADRGAEVARPAAVRGIELADAAAGRPLHRLTVEAAGAEPREVAARWLIDASGRRGVLARKLGLQEKLADHPISSSWARWDGVADADGPAVQGPDPADPRMPRIPAPRGLSTNHFCGHGWWSWVIPLKGGRTSVGLTFDRRLFEPPPLSASRAGSQKQRYEAFVRSAPGLSTLLADATMDASDFAAYRDCAFRSTAYAGEGWALVGDAASFLDPLYSPGLDHVAFSSYATAAMVADDLAAGGEPSARAAAVTRHNAEFVRSYENWYAAIYRGKYALLGDPELLTASYFMDIGSYYFGVLDSVVRGLDGFRRPPMGGLDLPSRVAPRVLAAVKDRMIRLAGVRRELGLTGPGRAAAGGAPRRRLAGSFELGPTAIRRYALGVRLWLRTEAATALARAKRGRRPGLAEGPGAAAGPNLRPAAAA
ncbi:NAD(P)/FAD-dependent oxidoreductase [Phycisphaera mikurensis]|uniref:Putative oxidoreductase n=1 Tax=Phycisphaera mikurensis (strain NBRC 102666 / KCTC 22515 / FYK2301M01) TaxID=1142394 RepID=I0IAR2_PHYMF|nr:tryptophan 7-halogenase [Phycisphaera mikurensis]MBB6442674.1 flavin-dependent dehydrogenase [Phycisphaera mikurensis]BAM02350.1 putative oxidoreductase [Phycisphaera mikurensis NBRC 102666]